MTGKQHTPGPWKLMPSIGDGRVSIHRAGMAFVVADCGVEENKWAHANARRIVACVNACEGIDTETLQAMDRVVDVGNYADKMRQQRDALVVAAQRGIAALAANGAPNCEAAKELRAAIAKAQS